MSERSAASDMEDLIDLIRSLQTDLPTQVTETASEIWGRLQSGATIYWFGNGGSAAMAQHLSAELVWRLRTNRPALASVALSADSAALTAIANDSSFGHIYGRQIEALGSPGDVAIGLTTSGISPNVIQALGLARRQGLYTIAMTGPRLVECAHRCFDVVSSSTARIQEAHLLIGHLLCAELERLAVASMSRSHDQEV